MAKLFVFLLFSLLVVVSHQELVKLTLYYESLCPFCCRFATKQLEPVYRKLGKENIVLDLVPYGLATHEWKNGAWQFKCQHGPRECYTNKVQACVLNLGYSQDTEGRFVDCVLAQKDPSSVKSQKRCAKRGNIKWNEVKRCVESEDGAKYLVQFGERTEDFYDTGLAKRAVPAVVFNDRYNETLKYGALRDLMKTICSLYTHKPKGCQL